MAPDQIRVLIAHELPARQVLSEAEQAQAERVQADLLGTRFVE